MTISPSVTLSKGQVGFFVVSILFPSANLDKSL